MTETRVHLVRKVERGRAAGQINDFTARCQCVDAILEKICTNAIDEIGILRRRTVLGGLQELSHPFYFLRIAGIARTTLLVYPMGGDAEFGLLMHVVRADLHFDRQRLRADHGRVDRTIEVVLRSRDVIVEFAGNIGPAAVHDAKCGVAIADTGAQDAHGAHVVQFLEGELLALHLSMDTVDVFRATADLGFDAFAREARLQLSAKLLHVAFAIDALLGERRGDFSVVLWLEVAERQILELPLHLPDAEAIGEWCKHSAGLGGQAPLSRRR